MVYIGPFETAASCQKWKEEYDLAFPVVADEDGDLFQRLTSGWVPWSILVGPTGKVLFSENEFDEEGYSAAIARLFASGADPTPERPETAMRPARPPENATVVILGGGVGGLVAAHRLRRKLGTNHRIVVIDRSSDHVFSSSLLWLMVGDRAEEQIRRPLDRLATKGIEFRREQVEAIDVDRRTVRTDSGELDFDYLIVALGAQTTPESVDGFSQMAHDLYSVDGCQQIHAELESFRGGKIGVVVTSMPFKCPAAPYETAFLVDSFLRKRGVRDRAQIHLYTPEHQPMPIAEPGLGKAVEAMLRQRNIQYHPLFTFETMRPQGREIVAADGRTEQVDLLIAVPPHQVPEVVRTSGLMGVSGWIHVDPGTLRTEYPGIFAIGDVTNVRLPNGKSLPKAGVFAHNEAEIVAERIATELQGRECEARFTGRGFCWIEIGDGKAGFAGGQFYHDPEPRVRMRRPGYLWHWSKVAFEKWWLWRWF